MPLSEPAAVAERLTLDRLIVGSTHQQPQSGIRQASQSFGEESLPRAPVAGKVGQCSLLS